MKAMAFGLMMAFVSQSALAITYAELSVEQKATVQKGGVVSVTKEVANKPWPEVTAFIRLEGTPEEAAAVWTDYNLHIKYVPELLLAKIVSPKDAKYCEVATCDVAYTIDLPWPWSNENYTVQDTTTYAGGVYTTSWKLLKADSTKQSKGYARFETQGTGTLMTYFNFVEPDSLFAGAVEDKAQKQVEAVCKGLGAQIVTERKEAGLKKLNEQIAALRKALGQ